MFQRVQSIFIIIAAGLIAASYFFPFGEVAEQSLATYGIKKDEDYLDTVRTYWFHIPFFLVFLLNLVSLFLFSNRMRQMALLRSTFFLFAAGFALLVFYIMDAQKVLGGEYKPGFSVFLPFAAMFFNWLAIRSIRKDEQLVRSVDRIR